MISELIKEIAISQESIGDKVPNFSEDLKNGESKSNGELGSRVPDFSIERIETRNQNLEGQDHPVSGVPFVLKQVKTTDGSIVEGVFPVFPSDFDAQLPDDLCNATDNAQFKESNKQLKEYVNNDPVAAKDKFSDEQLEDIFNGRTPEGCTWHHNEDKGKMQLIDSETHDKTGHTGGKSIWGGGSENR